MGYGQSEAKSPMKCFSITSKYMCAKGSHYKFNLQLVLVFDK